MNFRGIELEFDILDADQADVYEEARLRVLDGAEEEIEGESYADAIRRLCGLVFDFFDDTCGDGTHRKVFGSKVNYRDCFQAFKDFAGAVEADREAALKELTEGVPRNRAERRAASRGK